MTTEWKPMGTLQAAAYWQEFDVPITTREVRVSYSGTIPVYPNEIRGFFRLRYDAETFSGKWFRLYPKPDEKEVYVFDEELIEPFKGPIRLQFRRWAGRSARLIADWAITVENLVSSQIAEGQALLAFGAENTTLYFGSQLTTFV